jgi:hypothetical protein
MFLLDNENGNILSEITLNKVNFNTDFIDIIYIKSNNELNELYFIGLLKNSQNIILMKFIIDDDDRSRIKMNILSKNIELNSIISIATSVTINNFDTYIFNELVYNDEYSIMYCILNSISSQENNNVALIISLNVHLPNIISNEFDDNFYVTWKQTSSFPKCLTMNSISLYDDFCIANCVSISKDDGM